MLVRPDPGWDKTSSQTSVDDRYLWRIMPCPACGDSRPRKIGTPMRSRNPGLTRSHVDRNGPSDRAPDGPAESRTRPSCPLQAGCTSPCRYSKRRAARKNDPPSADKEPGRRSTRVSRACRIEMKHVTVCRRDAEVLMLQIAERSGHENSPGKQHHSKRGLKTTNAFAEETTGLALQRFVPRKTSAGCACDDNHAGARPNSTPVTSDTRNAKPRTVREGLASMAELRASGNATRELCA